MIQHFVIKAEHVQFRVTVHETTDLYGKIETNGGLELLNFVGVFSKLRQSVKTAIVDVFGGVLLITKQQIVMVFLVGDGLAIASVQLEFHVFGQ